MPSVSGPVLPLGTSYPVAHDEHLLGGYRVVADTVERDAIPEGMRKAGMLVFVQDAGVRYKLTGSAGSWSWVADVGSGSGDLLASNNLSDVANTATAFANIKQAATTTATGVVELATDGENAANVVVQGNDSRLSNARTPTSHNNTSHSETYITAAGVTFANLSANGAVGTGATQVAIGNHTHAGVYDPAGTAASAVSGHESTYNHANFATAYGWGNHASAGYALASALHAAATVSGNGISIAGQQISLSIGTGATDVAAGNHTHAGVYAPVAHSHEGTAILSTGELGGTKFLREDGDGTSSWQSIPGGGDALTTSPLSQFAATTSLQLAGVISDETGTGSLVFANTPTLVTPILGVASATSINKVAVTAPATSATLTLADGSTLVTSGAYSITLTSTAATNVTLPTTGTLATTAQLPLTSAIGFVIDGGGSAITTGIKGDIEVTFACTITAARLLADQSGSIAVGVWKDTYANFPPTVDDLIDTFSITTATKSEETGLSLAVSAGDILRFNVDSASTITRATLSLTVTRS